MAYEIKGDVVHVRVPYEGKEAEFVVGLMSAKEWAYAMDEFMMVKQGSGATIRIGVMILATLTKCIIKAPFPLENSNTILEKKMPDRKSVV